MVSKQPQWPTLPWHVTNQAASLPADHNELAALEDQRWVAPETGFLTHCSLNLWE